MAEAGTPGQHGDDRIVIVDDTIQLETPPALGRSFDPVRHKAETARKLAYGLLVIFALSMLAAVIMAFSDDIDAGVNLAQTIGPLTGGPLAVAVGYYFGASK